MYYKRNLSTCNLTVYNLGNKAVTRYMWHENVARRGSCEIAICLQKFIECLPPGVKKLVLFSDTRGGQNRNQNFSSMCLHTVADNNLDYTEHLYFESSYSQMEADSVHSSIENVCRRQNIYAPSYYHSLVKVARRNDPYGVVVMDTDMFFGYKALSRETLHTRSKDSEGDVVKWLKVKLFKYEKKNLRKTFYKYNHSNEFREINACGKRRGKRSLTMPIVTTLFMEAPSLLSTRI